MVFINISTELGSTSQWIESFPSFRMSTALKHRKEHLNTSACYSRIFFIIFAVGTHSPSGLSVNLPYHFFSSPRPKTDECLGLMFRAYWATRVALSQYSFWLFLSNTWCHCTWTWKWSCLQNWEGCVPFSSIVGSMHSSISIAVFPAYIFHANSTGLPLMSVK